MQRYEVYAIIHVTRLRFANFMGSNKAINWFD